LFLKKNKIQYSMPKISPFSIVVYLSCVLSVCACQPTGFSVAAHEAEEEEIAIVEAEEIEVVKDSISLTALWDSLQRGQMVFAVDSVDRLSSKEAKQRLRDSIITELNKHKKHIYLAFDDGPLIGSAYIDSIVTAKGVKMSAFLVGKHAQMSKKLHRDFQRYMDTPLVAC